MKGWKGNLVAFCIASIVGLLLLEVAIRVLLPRHNPSGRAEFFRNADGLVLGRPNTTSRHWNNAGDFDIEVQFNAYGLRDRKDLQQSSSEDIFVVGDSFAFGTGVEENERFSNLLQKTLGVPVFNISIPLDLEGYRRLVAYAVENGATIKRLIVAICMENDLRDYEAEVAEYDMKRNERINQFKSLLTKNSATYNAIASLAHQNAALRCIALRFGLITPADHGVVRNIYDEEVLRSSVAQLLVLREQQELSDLLVVLIPSRGLWLGDHQQSEALVHERFAELLHQEGFDVLDLRTPWEESDDPLQYHFENDGHWNAQGHRQAAERIASRLQNWIISSR